MPSNNIFIICLCAINLAACNDEQFAQPDPQGLFSQAEQNRSALDEHHALSIKVISIKHVIDEKGFAPKLSSNIKLSTESPQWPYIWCRINMDFSIGKKSWKTSKMVYFNHGEATLENVQDLNRFGIKSQDVKLSLSSDGWVPAFPASFDLSEETSAKGS